MPTYEGRTSYLITGKLPQKSKYTVEMDIIQNSMGL